MKDSSKVVVIKKYNNTAEAYMDQALLENEGIESHVDHQSGMLPMVEMVTLSVAETDVKHALTVVPDSSVEG